jgi:hypothetical protein
VRHILLCAFFVSKKKLNCGIKGLVKKAMPQTAIALINRFESKKFGL